MNKINTQDWNGLKIALRNEFGKDVIIHFYNDKQKSWRRIKACVLTSDLNKVIKFSKKMGYEVSKFTDHEFVSYFTV
jgi:hypothetical protein